MDSSQLDNAAQETPPSANSSALAALLDAGPPDLPSTWGEREHEFVASLWDEMTRVAGVAAWRATISLTGQLFEALVKQVLLEAGKAPSALRRMTFGMAAKELIESGLLNRSEPDPSRDGRSVLSASVSVRNWVAHGASWQRSPTERNAAQAVALLRATASRIFGSDEPVAALAPSDPAEICWTDGTWLMYDRSSLQDRVLTWVTHDRNAVDVLPWHELFPHFMVGRKSLRQPLRLWDAVRRRPELPLKQLVTAMGAALPSFVDATPGSRIKELLRLVRLLHAIGHRAQAQVLAILLPTDAQTLTHLLDRSAKVFLDHLHVAKLADPALFSGQLHRDHSRSITAPPDEAAGFTAAYATTVRESVEKRGWLAAAFGNVPAALRWHVVYDLGCEQLREWVRTAPPRNGVQVVWSLAPTDDATRAPFREAALVGLSEAIANSDCFHIQELPRTVATLRQGRLVVVDAVLSRVADSEDWQRVARVLLDVQCYHRDREDATARAALVALSADPGRIHDWDALALVVVAARRDASAMRELWNNLGRTLSVPDLLSLDPRDPLNTLTVWIAVRQIFSADDADLFGAERGLAALDAVERHRSGPHPLTSLIAAP